MSDLDGQVECDGTSRVGVNRQTLSVQPKSLAKPLSLPAMDLAKAPWVSSNRDISHLPELKCRVCWAWARAGRAAGPHGVGTKP